MRFLSYLMTFFMAALLAACGGGGGSPGLSNGSGAAFSVAAPSKLTLQVGLTQQYTVKGGVKPYTVFSTNPAVAVGWLVGDDVFAVGTAAPGEALVTVRDATKDNKFEMVVTAGSSTAFFTTAPTTLALSPGLPQSYTLGGGTKPYTATSNFPSVAAVRVNGDSMTITGSHIDELNPVIITMRDAAGAILTTTVKVVTTKLEISQGEYKVFLGDTVRLFIRGGTPPYRVLNPLNDVADIRIVNGNEVEVVGLRLADPVEPLIIDADNQTASGAKITFMPGGDNYLRISPGGTLADGTPIVTTIPENSNSPNIVLNVYGVAPGSSISVFTTNNTLLIPGTPVKIRADGSAYTITLSGGNTCSLPTPGYAGPPPDPGLGSRMVTITVLDSAGRSGISKIQVTDSDGMAGCSF